MATVKGFKADVSSVSPLSDRFTCFKKVVVKNDSEYLCIVELRWYWKFCQDTQTTKNKSCKKRSKWLIRIRLKDIRWPRNKSKGLRNVITRNPNNYYNSITKIQMSIASYTSRYEIAHEVHLWSNLATHSNRSEMTS